MSKFFIDLLIFQTLPYYSPMVSAALSVVSFFCLITSMGLVYGFPIWLLIFSLCLRSIIQANIVAHRDRIEMGITLGVALSWLYIFIVEIYMKSYVSYGFAVAGLSFFFCVLLFAILFHTRSPDREKSLLDRFEAKQRLTNVDPCHNPNIPNISTERNSSLLKRVLAMSPAEGTYEEFEISVSCSESLKLFITFITHFNLTVFY